MGVGFFGMGTCNIPTWERVCVRQGVCTKRAAVKRLSLHTDGPLALLGPNLLIVSFSSAKVTKHNEGGRVLPLLHYIEMLHFRRFFLVYTHPTQQPL